MAFKALGNEPLRLRRGTTDAQVAWYTLKLRGLLPPHQIGAPRVIVDLGANIGVATAQLASLFPAATILAVEPDPENAACWRSNIAPWKTRCDLIEGAVWEHADTVLLTLSPGAEDAAHVSTSGAGVSVQAVTLAEIVGRVGEIDYLKVNIEGAERELLASSGWEHVRAVKIEVHEPFSPEQCCRELEALGFESSLQITGQDSFAIGVRAAGLV